MRRRGFFCKMSYSTGGAREGAGRGDEKRRGRSCTHVTGPRTKEEGPEQREQEEDVIPRIPRPRNRPIPILDAFDAIVPPPLPRRPLAIHVRPAIGPIGPGCHLLPVPARHVQQRRRRMGGGGGGGGGTMNGGGDEGVGSGNHRTRRCDEDKGGGGQGPHDDASNAK